MQFTTVLAGLLATVVAAAPAAAQTTTVTAILCTGPDLTGTCHPQPNTSGPDGNFPTTPYILNSDLVRAGVGSGAVNVVPAGVPYEVELWSTNNGVACSGALLATFEAVTQ